MTISIRPMPIKYGYGFTSDTELPGDFAGEFEHRSTGRYHNYHATTKEWRWPITYSEEYAYKFDAFSPNLNKEFHVGHLRNLAIAKSLKSMFRYCASTKFVSLLGCSLGVKKAALLGWKWWTDFLSYRPEVFYDVIMPDDVIDTREPTVEEVEKGVIDVNEGPDLALPRLWDGPHGPVVVIRASGKPLYAFYDLVFAKEVAPTHYITGHEQKSHFRSIGLEEKHLPMGLVLGEDGKKMKSRTGDALPAMEAMSMVRHHLRDIEDERRSQQIAWNILAWNFLHASRSSDMKFEVEKWVRPESPGMYITYTSARVRAALEPHTIPFCNFEEHHLEQADADLLCLSDQSRYYRHRAMELFDPSPLANYTHDLARALGAIYEKERIRGGRDAFKYSIAMALMTLNDCMGDLGMFVLNEV